MPLPTGTGETFAGYTIVRLLGSGGMGEVYLVQHPRLPRQDALKVLRRDVSADASFRDRFIREADLAAGLWHPHIIGVHDRGEYEGQLWIAMDYVDGLDAAQLMQRRYPVGMPAKDVADIVTAVASVLDYAHKRGLLHRDVKPANIMLTQPDDDQRRILLTDFEIARPVDDTKGLTTTNMGCPVTGRCRLLGNCAVSRGAPANVSAPAAHCPVSATSPPDHRERPPCRQTHTTGGREERRAQLEQSAQPSNANCGVWQSN
jgi:serine/threonine protein kinase